ncbi:carboxymuconolactone decarboxylase (plasmid) [Alcanivorax sp. N3-2A]|nr:carboxymuconolactone decarboxylase [Alcanivorax sp. N3-2A]ASK36720.1 carboxymuconolactone decarboxylase [Alcanivorax sp. N3-2A]|tara:strand:- start:8604 stop:9134 length:531 start_codon:yes stop_codon:yes gene_type:complete
MARIPYADVDSLSDELRALVASRRPLNIYRMLAHGGPAAEGFLALGSALLRENSLDTQWRELVIVRVGILCRAPYEVHQHTRLALSVGIEQQKIDALYDGPDAALFSEQERTLLRYTDTVVLNVKAGETAFRAMEKLLSAQQLVELHLLIGFYMMVSRFLENFEVDLEDSEPAPSA